MVSLTECFLLERLENVTDDTGFFWIDRSGIEGKELKPGTEIKKFKGYLNGQYDGLEKMFEEVRKKDFSDRPPRIGSVFVSPDRETAEKWTSSSGQGTLYRVSVTGKVFYTNAEMWTEAALLVREYRLKTSGQLPDEVKERVFPYIREYWEGGDKTFGATIEVIVKGTVKIVEKV